MADSVTLGNLAVMWLLAGSIAVWIAIALRWRRGLPAVEYRPRETCPWHAMAVGLAIPVSIIVQAVALSSVPEGERLSLRFVQSQSLAVVLEICVLMGLLALGTPIRASDFGLAREHLLQDAGLGLLGYLAAFLPVYAVSRIIQDWGFREEGAKHTLLKLLEEQPGWGTTAWVALAAVVLAPLAEELLYRVVIQGWLETRISPRAAILFVAIVFAWIHAGAGRPDHLPLFPLALILGYLYHRRHSYAAVVVLHAAFNATNLALAILVNGQ